MPVESWVLEGDGYWRSDYDETYSARDNYAYGTYRPDASTTGILSDRSALTVVNGNYMTVTANEVIENKWIKGAVTVKHLGVVIRNCLITGDTAGPSSPSYSAIKAYDPGTSVDVYDCTIESAVNSVYAGNGAMGRDIRLYRCDISNFVDGVGLFRNNGGVYGCWIHDLPYYSWSPSHSDGSHNDGIQIHGGSDYEVIGNSVEMGYESTTGLIVTQDDGITSDVLINRNWFISTWPTKATAAGVGVNISASGSGGVPYVGITLTDNQFSPFGQWSSNHAALITNSSFDAVTKSGNVNVGTATAAKVSRG